MTLPEYQSDIYDRLNAEFRRFNAELARQYRVAMVDIRREIEELYSRVLAGVTPEQYYSTAVKYQRLSKLQELVMDAYRRAAAAAGRDIRNASQSAFVNSYFENQYALQLAVAEAQGISVAFVGLPEKIVEAAVMGTPTVFRELRARAYARWAANPEAYRPRPNTLTDLLLRNRTRELAAVRDAVTQALIQGRSVDQATRMLDRQVAIGRNNAQRILRTETHRSAVMGQYAASSSAKHDGANIRRQIISVLDDRTRLQSAIVDTQFEDEQGYFRYPGGVPVLIPGNSGYPRWDINDREVVVDSVVGFPVEQRRVAQPQLVNGRPVLRNGQPVFRGSTTWSFTNFQSWAEEVGLTRNRYGELVAQSR